MALTIGKGASRGLDSIIGNVIRLQIFIIRVQISF